MDSDSNANDLRSDAPSSSFEIADLKPVEWGGAFAVGTVVLCRGDVTVEFMLARKRDSDVVFAAPRSVKAANGNWLRHAEFSRSFAAAVRDVALARLARTEPPERSDAKEIDVALPQRVTRVRRTPQPDSDERREALCAGGEARMADALKSLQGGGV